MAINDSIDKLIKAATDTKSDYTNLRMHGFKLLRAQIELSGDPSFYHEEIALLKDAITHNKKLINLKYRPLDEILRADNRQFIELKIKGEAGMFDDTHSTTETATQQTASPTEKMYQRLMRLLAGVYKLLAE